MVTRVSGARQKCQRTASLRLYSRCTTTSHHSRASDAHSLLEYRQTPCCRPAQGYQPPSEPGRHRPCRSSRSDREDRVPAEQGCETGLLFPARAPAVRQAAAAYADAPPQGSNRRSSGRRRRHREACASDRRPRLHGCRRASSQQAVPEPRRSSTGDSVHQQEHRESRAPSRPSSHDGHRRFQHEPFRTGPREFRLLSRGDVSKDSAAAIKKGRQPHSVFLLQPNVESLRRSSSESPRVLLPSEFGTHGVFLAFVRPSPASAGHARILSGRRNRDSHPDWPPFAPGSKRHSRFQDGVGSPAAVS